MFQEEFLNTAAVARKKVDFLNNNPLGYFLMSMLAGMFIGMGLILVFTISGQLDGAPYTKVLMGVFFSAGLSLVVIAGAELFTGNNFVMTAGVLRKTVSVVDTLKLWGVCWLGNFGGAVLLAFLFSWTGLHEGTTLAAVLAGADAKMNASFVELFTRGILCNFLVCLAIWSTYRAKTEAGKLIMIFWCIVAFITTGFEHSIANMTLLTLAMINNGGLETIGWGGYWFNLAVVTLGNIIGGVVFVALPYCVASRDK